MTEVEGMGAKIHLPLFLVVALLLGCRDAAQQAFPDLSIREGWARAMPFAAEGQENPSNSAVYLVIQNQGRAGDVLTGAETGAAGSVEIHATRMVEDVMRMRKLEALKVPPEGSVELEPGGIHLMLLGLNRPLLEGEDLDLTLRFEEAGEVTVTVPVRLMAGG